MKKYQKVSLIYSKAKAAWFLRRHGDRKLLIIEEAAKEYFLSFLVPKWPSYLPRLLVLLGRIMQSVLVDRCDEDAK
jgi:hypothetical protein